jgi:DNA-binding MarR family transcriptional regulator
LTIVVTTTIYLTVTGRILIELKQTRPIANQIDEAALNILRTADSLRRHMMEALKPHQLSLSGYNALRILRGSKDIGLTCGEISARMISQDPDITRLIDRLEKRSFVDRSRDKVDRRVVRCRIAPAGLVLLKKLETSTVVAMRDYFAHINSTGLTELIDALEGVRAKCDGPLP